MYNGINLCSYVNTKIETKSIACWRYFYVQNNNAIFIINYGFSCRKYFHAKSHFYENNSECVIYFHESFSIVSYEDLDKCL